MTTLATMYPAQTNSPTAALTGAVSTEATSITINDASVFSDLQTPFELTLGIDSSQAETVLVTGVSGNTLTVTRGWDGTASAWIIGTLVARTFSARDLNDLQDNVAALHAGKQEIVSDLAAIRSGATLGATAYQKPSGGIPKADLANAVQMSLSLADSALQSHQSLAAYRTAADQDTVDAGKQATITASGILKGNGQGGISAAVAGTDYVAANDSRLSDARTPTAHNQAASTITAGTLAGKVQANATAAGTVGDAQVRDIYAGTTDMTAGTSVLASGTVYLVYE